MKLGTKWASGVGKRFRCASPFLAGVLGRFCWCACSASTPPILGGVRGACALVWFLAFTRPVLAGVVACVCWRSQPANPGWGVWYGRVCLGPGFSCAPLFLPGLLGCVCWCACSAGTQPVLARVCGVCACRFRFWL